MRKVLSLVIVTLYVLLLFVSCGENSSDKEISTPLKTELEIIQETTFNNLTKKQKLSIIYWIEDRYDYYDKLAGGYTGDKYTKTIFNEAAERYNKSYTQINEIWNQSYQLKYG